MEYLLGIYFLIGLGVASWLSRREIFGSRTERGIISKLIWIWAVAGLWPLATLNYLLHFRPESRVEGDSKRQPSKEQG